MKKVMFLLTACFFAVSGWTQQLYLNESFTNSTFPPSNWTQAKGLVSEVLDGQLPVVGSSMWHQTDETYGLDEPHAIVNVYGTTCKEWLITPTINLGENPDENNKLMFDLALTAYGNDEPIHDLQGQPDDKFMVLISTDNGASWTVENVLISFDNAQSENVYNEIPSEKTTLTIPLSNYSGMVKIAFYVESTVSNGDNELHIDNVIVGNISCGTPSGLTVSNVTSSSMELNWTVTSEVSAWQLAYRTAGNEWNYEFIDQIPYIMSVEPGSLYEIKMRSICGEEDTSMWSNSVTQVTPCASMDIPYTQNFEQLWVDSEDGISNVYRPMCWFNVNGANQDYYWKSTPIESLSGERSAMMSGSISSANTISDWLITPVINLTGNERLSFYIKKVTESNPVRLKIYYFSTAIQDISSSADTSLFTLLETVDIADIETLQWLESEVVLSELNGPYRLALVSNDNSGPFYVDDLSITTLPECMRPAIGSLEAEAVTSTSVTLSWDDSHNSSWKIYYRKTSETQYMEMLTSDNPATVGGLEAGQEYTAYVVTVCGENESEPTRSITFRTACGVISDFPWFEGFEETWNEENLIDETIEAPYCWINVNGGSSSLNWIRGTFGAFQGSGYASSRDNNPSNAEIAVNSDWLITPVFELSGEESLYFYARKMSSTGNPALRLYALNVTSGDFANVSDTADFTCFDTVSDISSDWALHEIDLSGLNGQYRLAFVRNMAPNQGIVYIDNLEIMETPSCSRVSDFRVVSVGSENVELAWQTDEGQSLYKVYYKPSASYSWTIENTTSNSIILTNLSPATEYVFNIKAVCEDGTETGFIASSDVVAMTGCGSFEVPFVETFEEYPADEAASCWKEGTGLWNDVVSGNASVEFGSSSWNGVNGNGFDYHASMEYYGDKAEWLITPAINIGDGTTSYELSFDLAFTYWNNNSPAVNSGHQKFVVAFSTDGGQTWDEQTALVWDSTSDGQTNPRIDRLSNQPTRIYYNLTQAGYTGDITIGFYAENPEGASAMSGDNRIRLDNVRIDETGSCPDMLSIDVDYASSTSVAVSWNALEHSSAEGWKVSYAVGNVNSNPDENEYVFVPYGSAFPYIIDNLIEGETYTFVVQYDCQGTWSSPTTITLPVGIAEVPYSCDFEQEDENSRWVIKNLNGSDTKWYIGQETAVTDDQNKKLFISRNDGANAWYDYNEGELIVFAYRDVLFGSDAAYELSFDWKAGGEGHYDFMKVAIRDYDEEINATDDIFDVDWTGYDSEDWLVYPSEERFFSEQPEMQRTSIFIDGAYVNNSIKRLVFAWRMDGSAYTDSLSAIVDNISIRVVECFKPTDILINPSDVQTNSITLNLETESGESWEIQYREMGEENWMTQTVTSNENIVLDNLASGTVYEIRVRSVCGDETSLFTDVVSCQTKCEVIEVTQTTPYVEGFNQDEWYSVGNITTAGSSAPVCWFNINGKYSGYSWKRTTTSSTVYEGEGALKMESSTSASSDDISDWFISPVLDLNGNETMSFFAKKGSVDESFKIMYYSLSQNGQDIQSAGDTALFAELQTVNLTQDGWLNVDIPLQGLTGQYRLAFYACVPGERILIDSLSVSVQSCLRPNATTVTIDNITSNSAEINWTDQANSSWTVYYKPTNEESWNSVEVTVLPATLTELESGVSYEFYIVANCQESTESEPTAMFGFKTECVPVAELPWEEGFEDIESENTMPMCMEATRLGSKVKTFTSSSSSNSALTPHQGEKFASFVYGCDDYIFTPGFELDAQTLYSFSFWYLTDGTNGWTTLEAHLCKAQSADSIISGIGTALNNKTNIFYEQFTGDFNVEEDGVYYIAIHCSATSAPWYLSIDDLQLSESGQVSDPCQQPTNLTVDNITQTSAQITWDNEPEGASWQVRLGEEGEEVNVTVSNHTFEGLTPETQYTAYVRTECQNSYSEWVSVSFTTLEEDVVEPVVTTLSAINVSHSAATLRANVVEGNQTITERGFLYKEEFADEWSDVQAQGVESLIATVEDLSPATRYEFKAYVRVDENTYEGNVETFMTTSGLEDVVNGTINSRIYPNPAENKVTVEVKGLNRESVIIMSDLQGRVLERTTLKAGDEDCHFDLSDYASGVYYIRIVNDEAAVTHKLIVK